jgi:hypothetical protein
MARNKKTTKPPKSRKSILKTQKLIKSNLEVIRKLSS